MIEYLVQRLESDIFWKEDSERTEELIRMGMVMGIHVNLFTGS